MRFDFMICSEQDLIDAVQTFGFIPLFRNSIRGFSAEEHCSPKVWFSDTEDGVWEWKGPVIQKTRCAYGKFFEKKAALVSQEWFYDLANYRRDGYDFDARYDDGLASRQDKDLFELLDAHAPVLSKDLKAIGKYRKGGRKGFDTCINRLQEQCYVLISDFVYLKDKVGKPYGWGVAEYSTPERFMGQAFVDRVYQRAPEESCERLLTHLHELLPETEENVIRRLLK